VFDLEEGKQKQAEAIIQRNKWHTKKEN
jgi:hypothetical protein